MPWVRYTDCLMCWLVVGQDRVLQYCSLFYQSLLIGEYRTWVEWYLAGRNSSMWGKACPSNILFTTHPTYSTLELKSGMCNVKMTANYLSYLMALLVSWNTWSLFWAVFLGETKLSEGYNERSKHVFVNYCYFFLIACSYLLGARASRYTMSRCSSYSLCPYTDCWECSFLVNSRTTAFWTVQTPSKCSTSICI